MPPQQYLVKAFKYNLLISILVAGLLMLRADTLSWMEFLRTLIPSLIYSFSCGAFATAAMYFTEHRCYDSLVQMQFIILFGLGLLSGAVGEFIGTAILIVLDLKGPPGITPRSYPFWHRLSATWIYIPLFSLITAFACSMIYGFERMKKRLETTASALKEKELQTERLLKLSAEAELRALQARINPHFLFNTLNSIAALISEDPKKAEEMTEKLSALFRYTLSANRSERVPLAQELHILQSYIDIEQLRLGSRLRVTTDIDEDLHSLNLPPLLLQPIVENSIKYAVAPREEGGDIVIRGYRQANKCIIEVIDDGPGFDGQMKGTGYALENIRQRMEASYGAEHNFSISRKEGKTLVRIEVPAAMRALE